MLNRKPARPNMMARMFAPMAMAPPETGIDSIRLLYNSEWNAGGKALGGNRIMGIGQGNGITVIAIFSSFTTQDTSRASMSAANITRKNDRNPATPYTTSSNSIAPVP